MHGHGISQNFDLPLSIACMFAVHCAAASTKLILPLTAEFIFSPLFSGLVFVLFVFVVGLDRSFGLAVGLGGVSCGTVVVPSCSVLAGVRWVSCALLLAPAGGLVPGLGSGPCIRSHLMAGPFLLL